MAYDVTTGQFLPDIPLLQSPSIGGGGGTVVTPAGSGGGTNPTPSAWESFVQSFGQTVGQGINRFVQASADSQIQKIYGQQGEQKPKTGVGPTFAQQVQLAVGNPMLWVALAVIGVAVFFMAKR
jgi:hypothetical protein